MRRLILLLFLCLFFVVPTNADITVIVIGGTGAAGVSYEVDLKCDDDAASTTVSNDGTEGTAWIASHNTDTLYIEASADCVGANNPHDCCTGSGTGDCHDPDGYGAFLIDGNAEYIKSDTNWDSEQLEIIFWWQPHTTTADSLEVVVANGNSDASIAANEFLLYRSNATDEFTFRGQGNTGSYGTRTTNDASWSNDTWYRLKLEIDASANDWTVTLSYSTDGTSYTALTWAEGSGWTDSTPQLAVFNSDIHAGETSTYAPDCLFGQFLVRDTS